MFGFLAAVVTSRRVKLTVIDLSVAFCVLRESDRGFASGATEMQ